MLESVESFLAPGLLPDREKEVRVTSSATVTAKVMSVYERSILITTDATNALTVTLPSVAEAKGKIYFIRLVTDGGKNVTIEDKNGDAGLSDITLADAGDGVCLISDGYVWYVLGTIGLLATDYD